LSEPTPTRVHYFPGQFLRTQDFSDEQDYHLDLHRRHNVGGHTWGIVVGLELVADDEGGLVVQPGAAVDGFGRDLVVAEPLPVPTAAFSDRGSDALEVWLGYDRVGSDRVPPGYGYCGDGGEESFLRWLERPLLRFEVPDPAFADPRRPRRVAVGDLGFDSSRTAPEDRPWPVFLGTVTRDLANAAQPYAVDLAGRPYAGLVGESVVAPSGRARIELSDEQADDPHRFSVFVPQAEGPQDRGLPRLSIAGSGGVEIRGDTSLHGDLTVVGRAIELGEGTVRDPADPPWRLYRVRDGTEHELRVEMAGSGGGTPGLNQVVIGTFVDGAFQPCLTVADDCTVTVHGNLVVEGEIRNPEYVRGVLGDDADRLAVAAFMTGSAGPSSLLPRLYRSPFPSGVSPEDEVRALAQRIAADPDLRSGLAETLRARHPSTTAALRAELEDGPG
jgi:hypothetical protein